MIRVVHPGSQIPDPDFLPIPDPGSRGQKGTGSQIRIRNTGINTKKWIRIQTLHKKYSGSILINVTPVISSFLYDQRFSPKICKRMYTVFRNFSLLPKFSFSQKSAVRKLCPLEICQTFRSLIKQNFSRNFV